MYVLETPCILDMICSSKYPLHIYFYDCKLVTLLSLVREVSVCTGKTYLREFISCNLGKMNDSGMLSHKLYFAITPKKKIWGHCERRGKRNIRSEERGMEWSSENSHCWKWLGCHYQAHDICDYLHMICTRLDLPLKLLKERTLKVIPQKK